MRRMSQMYVLFWDYHDELVYGFGFGCVHVIGDDGLTMPSLSASIP